MIKNFGFQLWDPHQMNLVRGYFHDRYATLGVCDLRFLRYVLLNSSKEMEDNMSIDEDSTNRNVPKNPPLLCLQPHSSSTPCPPPTHPPTTPYVPAPILSGGEQVHLGVIMMFYDQIIRFTSGTFGYKNNYMTKFTHSLIFSFFAIF